MRGSEFFFLVSENDSDILTTCLGGEVSVFFSPLYYSINFSFYRTNDITIVYCTIDALVIA